MNELPGAVAVVVLDHPGLTLQAVEMHHVENSLEEMAAEEDVTYAPSPDRRKFAGHVIYVNIMRDCCKATQH